MSTENFRKLINEICAVSQIPDAERLHEMADLIIDEIQFTLIDASTRTEDAVAFYCDFGLPPHEFRAEALQRLLELNLGTFGINTPVFSINGETGHVLLMARALLEKMQSLELLNVLTQYAAQAKEWRKNHYLLDGERSRPMSAQPASQHVLKQRDVRIRPSSAPSIE